MLVPLVKVFQVRKKDTGQIYAMKVMRKERILEKDHAAYVWSERDVLTSLDHPYIVRMLYSFQVRTESAISCYQSCRNEKLTCSASCGHSDEIIHLKTPWILKCT